MFKRLVGLYDSLIGMGDWVQNYFLLAIRLYWGWQFTITGWGKIHSLPKVIQFFQSLNIPFAEANANFVAYAEFVGGIMLLLGFASRLSSVFLFAILCGAYATAHREALLNVLSDPDTFFSQAPFLFMYASIVVFCFGPGKFSIDYLIEEKVR